MCRCLAARCPVNLENSVSYDIYLYHPEVKSAALRGAELDGSDHPAIPDNVKNDFTHRLLKYDYKQESVSADCTEFVHNNDNWSIQVNVFRSEIAFSVPYWDDVENAVFEALRTAHELADNDDLVVYDPQTGEWSE